MDAERIEGMDFRDYAGREWLNASLIKAGTKSMKHMKAYADQRMKAESPALRIGRLSHACILEPDRFFADIQVFDGPKRGKAWTEFKEGHDPEWIVTEEESNALWNMSMAAHDNKEAHRLIEESAHEVSLFWEDKHLGKCKARLDGLHPTAGVVEIKTTGAIEPFHFFLTAYRLGYHMQCGWYQHGSAMVGNKSDTAMMISVEQKEPYDVVVYRMPEYILTDGYDAARAIGLKYRIHQECGIFPGVYDEIMEYDLPSWAKEKTGPVELTIGGEQMEV